MHDNVYNKHVKNKIADCIKWSPGNHHKELSWHKRFHQLSFYNKGYNSCHGLSLSYNKTENCGKWQFVFAISPSLHTAAENVTFKITEIGH